MLPSRLPPPRPAVYDAREQAIKEFEKGVLYDRPSGAPTPRLVGFRSCRALAIGAPDRIGQVRGR